MVLSTLLWSLVCVVTYELARVTGAFDYRTFFQRLLGSGWIVYELAYLVFMLVILAVIAAASGSLLQETFGLPYWVGVVGIMAAVGGLVFAGTEWIQSVMAGWSVVLYGAYIVLFAWCLWRFGGETARAFGEPMGERAWVSAGVRYAAYNVALIPPLLFSARKLRSRGETVLAGALTGPIAMIPGCLFFVAMVGHYPEILQRSVPANYLLEILGSRTFQVVFQLVLFGTLIETGTGLIHGMNERIAHVFQERGRVMPSLLRPVLAVGLLLSGTLLASVGLVDLIARGYGTLTWVFLLVFVLPVLTLGTWMIRSAATEPVPETIQENDPDSGPGRSG
jgi:uncharacterized membrane protein YkvI